MNAQWENLSAEAAAAVKQNRSKPSGGNFKYLRRDEGHDRATELRPPFVHDVDKILHSELYNRLSDKTQVISFYRNDDVSRRALHVQLVSRIARTLGSALGLDPDLIEAIAIGHDIGHTPFGHAGEAILDELLKETIGQRFSHNVQSVRVLDEIFEYNLTLETLDGILCHNGEMPSDVYRPRGILDFADFDERVRKCKADSGFVTTLVPATREGCLVRICDMIAYLGKDRQDYVRAGLGEESDFAKGGLMGSNSQIIHNLGVNIIENSVFGDCIRMDEEHYAALKKTKEENYRVIYMTDKVRRYYDDTVRPMMKQLFDRFVSDLKKQDENSIIYKHHIDFINGKLSYKDGAKKYLLSPPEIIAADFIASMTDSYFLDVHSELFGIRIRGYFHGI